MNIPMDFAQYFNSVAFLGGAFAETWDQPAPWTDGPSYGTIAAMRACSPYGNGPNWP